MTSGISSDTPLMQSSPQGKYGPIAPDRETKIQAALGEIDRATIVLVFALSMAVSCSLLAFGDSKALEGTLLANGSGFWWLPYCAAWLWCGRAIRKSRATWPQFHSGRSESIFLPSNLLLWAGILLLCWQTLVLVFVVIANSLSGNFPSRELISNEVFSGYMMAAVGFPVLWAISCLVKVYETLQWVKVLNGEKDDAPLTLGDSVATKPFPNPTRPGSKLAPEEGGT